MLEAFNPRGFSTTRWSLIATSAQLDRDEQKAHTALAELCQTYWRPVFSYCCRRGYQPDDAKDLTQDFFAMIVATHWVRHADQSRGRFRTLLLTALDNFIRDAKLKHRRAKRGGGLIIQWDDWMAAAPSHVTVSSRALAALAPARVFDLRWAVTVVEQALRTLAEECELHGRRRLFDGLSEHLGADRDVSYAKIAEQLALTEAQVKRQLHFLRLRYRTLLRKEVARTVQDTADIDDEIRNLCAALASCAQ